MLVALNLFDHDSLMFENNSFDKNFQVFEKIHGSIVKLVVESQ